MLTVCSQELPVPGFLILFFQTEEFDLLDMNLPTLFLPFLKSFKKKPVLLLVTHLKLF